MQSERYKVSLSDAQETLLAFIGQPKAVPLPVDEAFGRWLAEPVTAPQSLPRDRLALRDGVAQVDERQIAVLTGEVVPERSHGLIKSEGLGQPGSTPDPQYIREVGDDVRAGVGLFEAGTRLDSRELAVLRAAGVAEVSVFEPLRVSLEAPEGGMGEKMARDWLLERGVAVVDRHPHLVLAIAGDRPGAYGRLLERLRDVPFAVWKMAVRPGKHVAIGRREGVTWLVLPDHPVATWINLALLLQPAIRQAIGQRQQALPLAPTEPQWGEAGVVRALWARWQADLLVPLPDQAGQSLLAVRKAEALLLVPPEGGAYLPFVCLSSACCTTCPRHLPRP